MRLDNAKTARQNRHKRYFFMNEIMKKRKASEGDREREGKREGERGEIKNRASKKKTAEHGN